MTEKKSDKKKAGFHGRDKKDSGLLFRMARKQIEVQNPIAHPGKTVGLLLSDVSPSNQGFATLFGKELYKRKLGLISCCSDNSQDMELFYLKELISRKVSALVISPVPGDYTKLKTAVNSGIPVIIINRFVSSFEFDHVLFDLRAGICEAVDALVLEKTKRHLYQLAPKEIFEGIERRKAFEFALKFHGLHPDHRPVFPVEDTPESGYSAMKKLLAHQSKVDAVLCSSDYSAIGAVRAVLDRGLRIPEDIAICGCFNTPFSDFTNPRISTIDVNLKELTGKVIHRIEYRIRKSGRPVTEKISVPSRFVPKETT